MTGIEILAPYAPLAGVVGAVALMVAGIISELRKRTAKLAQNKTKAENIETIERTLPEGALWVHQGVIPRLSARATGEQMDITGTTMLACNGTYGANRGLDILIALDRAGLADFIVSILFWECDTATRARVDARLPEVYRDRVVFAFAPDFSGGFTNMSPDEVEENLGKWSVPLEKAIKEVVRLHLEHSEFMPSEILFPTSLGGHAKCAEFMAQQFNKLLPDTPIVGIVNLPSIEEQRDHFEELKPLYDKAGIDFWLISDSLQPDFEELDEVLTHTILGVTVATLRSPTSPRMNNIAKHVTSKQRGGIARYEYVSGEVVAHRLPADPAEDLVGYYVYRDQVESTLGTLIEYVERGNSTVSIDMPAGEEKRVTYDLALVAIRPNDMLDVSDYIEEQRKSADKSLSHRARPHLHGRENYKTIYSVWGPPIDPTHPQCRLIVIRIRAVANAHEMIGEIVKVPRKRRGPKPSKHTNGVVVRAEELDDF